MLLDLEPGFSLAGCGSSCTVQFRGTGWHCCREVGGAVKKIMPVVHVSARYNYHINSSRKHANQSSFQRLLLLEHAWSAQLAILVLPNSPWLGVGHKPAWSILMRWLKNLLSNASDGGEYRWLLVIFSSSLNIILYSVLNVFLKKTIKFMIY